MAEKPPGGVEHSITVEPPADGNAAAGSAAAGELQQMVSSADDKVMWKQLKSLNDIVFVIELLEYSGNAIGTIAFLWATVVLLGGFCSYLTRMDFWFATVMVFVEGTRVFISKDASVNQWLFGSTRAFRWDHFCFSDLHACGNLFAVIISMGISLTPIEFGSEIITGILKVAILAITSLLLTRRHWNGFEKAVVSLFLLASVCGGYYGFYKMSPHKFAYTRANMRAGAKWLGLFIAWLFGTLAGAFLTAIIMGVVVSACPEKPIGDFCLKVIVGSGLVCLPILQAKLGSKYRWLSISIAAALLTVNLPEATEEEINSSSSPQATLAEQNNRSSSQEAPPLEQEQSRNALLLGTWDLLLKIVDTIMPILFFWGVMFPLPGVPLKVSFYMLLSVISAVLVGNLQIPVAFLQILLSSLRLHSLLAGHHHSHRDYHPLPDGASPNLVPSIVVFFVLEICQGSSNILGIVLGLISFGRRRSLVHALGVTKEEWGAKAVNLYYHQACMTIKEKGLFPMEKSTPPSFDSFAIESLGCTSSEMQNVRLQVVDYYLQHGDSKSKSKLMAQIAKDATGIVTKIAGTISHLVTDKEILSSGNDTDIEPSLIEATDSWNGWDEVSGLLLTCMRILLCCMMPRRYYTLCWSSFCNDTDTVVQQKEQIRSSLFLSLNFVGRLAVARGKIGTRFRQELSGNPILLHSLRRILDLEQQLWKPATDVIKWLALHDEATAKEIGSTHEVIPKLMDVFLNTGDGREAAGEALANLTITSSDNCRTMLNWEAGPAAGRRDLIKNLIRMLQDEENISSVAANLLHNLCANFGDMLIDLDAKEDLKYALQMVMQIIIGNGSDKQLDAALCVASQIGYVIPKEEFAHVLAENNLAPNTDAAAELVGKLVDTLKSNIEPNLEFPRLRRFLIGTVISIVESCPAYIELFRQKGAEDALKMLKGSSSRLEKYKVFVEGEGMVPESTPMHEVVDKAKRLIIRV